ncbi:GNAT family N-acetyltransferase [Diplocloster agilis]|uniref:GNAT family N-acetyltransferase n=1 Tax=Diplocloster agilis TaxID=2850323 RepID=UPI0023AA6D0F|nr:GNAT family N-acetyltransferase [Diplocloster agilis]
MGTITKGEFGRQLFEYLLKDCSVKEITVNASPYAVPIYHKLGFRNTDTEQLMNGIRLRL